MKLFLVLVIAGAVLTLSGFALLFGSLGGGVPADTAFVGFALMVVGPITFVGGLVAYAVRRPSAKELAAQSADDYGTWHFRPVGLLLLVVALGAFVALGNWAEQYIPGINSGSRPLSGYVFGAVCLGLLSFRKVRNMVFYTGEVPAANARDDAAGRAEPPAEVDGGHERGS